MVIDSAKAAANLEQFFRDAADAKQSAALTDATSKSIDAACAKDAGFDTTSRRAQMGRPLSRQEVQARLLRLNRNLVFEQSKNYPDRWGIYILDPEANKLDLDLKCRGRRFLCGMPGEINSEFSVRKVKEVEGRTEFASHVPGWRDVLKTLITAKVISLVDAERVFETNKGRASEKWHGRFYGV